MTNRADIARNSKLFKPADVIILAALVIITVVVTLSVYRSKGVTVEIITPQKTVEYSLDTDRVIELEGLKVIIEKGAVHVEAADCPDKVCEKTGIIRYAHQSIVCLPKKITVRITEGGDLNGSTGQV